MWCRNSTFESWFPSSSLVESKNFFRHVRYDVTQSAFLKFERLRFCYSSTVQWSESWQVWFGAPRRSSNLSGKRASQGTLTFVPVHTICHGSISLWVNFKRTRPNYAVHQMKSSLVDACHLAERSIASMVLQVSFDLTFTGWDFRYPVMNQFDMA